MKQQGASICIRGGTIIDGTGRDPAPSGSILIEEDRIKAVAHHGDLQIPRGCQIIEAEGKTVLPGLIDCHVHIIYSGYHSLQEIDQEPLEMATIKAIHNAEAILRAGFTTVRDVGTRGAISTAVRDAINNRLIRGPRIVASGQIICTTGGLVDSHPAWVPCHLGLGLVVDGPWEIAKAVRQQVKGGVDLIKLAGGACEASPYTDTWMSGITNEEIRIAVSIAHDYGRRVAFHGQALESTKAALREGVDTIEHGTRLDEEAVTLFRQKNITLVPTLTTLYSVLEFPEQQKLLAKQVREMRVNKDLWLSSLRLAYEAGVRIAVGTDIGNRMPHGANAIELQYLVQNGMSPMEAIVAATQYGAQAIGLGEYVGTLEPGKIADILIVEGNPLSDITILQDQSNLFMIIQGGKPVGPVGVR